MNLDRHFHRGGRVWKLKCHQVNKPKTSFDSLQLTFVLHLQCQVKALIRQININVSQQFRVSLFLKGTHIHLHNLKYNILSFRCILREMQTMFVATFHKYFNEQNQIQCFFLGFFKCIYNYLLKNAAKLGTDFLASNFDIQQCHCHCHLSLF